MNHEQPMTEAIDLARQFFQQRFRHWARPMVNVLERLRPKLALRWAIVVFQESLSTRRKSGSESQQRAWLEDLTALIERDDVAVYCDKIAYEAWQNDPVMNLLERGIARLFWALQNHLIGQMEDYHLQVAAAIGMLAGNEDLIDDEPTLERSIALFRHLSQQANPFTSRSSN